MALILFAAILVISLVIIPLGLPGLWVMIASAVGYNILVGATPIGWFTLIGVTVLAVVAEVIEFTLAGKFARKYGGSRRASWGAVIGGVIGAILGLPIPVIGPIVGGFLGSFGGALVGELSQGSTRGDAARVATGALIGRLFATAIKVGVGSAIAVWLFFAAMT